MQSTHITILIGLNLALAACAPATRTTIFQSYSPKPVGSAIKIYGAKSPICDFEELGIVSSRQRNKFISMEDVVESLRVEARSLGGDAILGLTETNPINNVTEYGVDRDPVLAGTVIRFSNPDCAE